jgi:hypothetical protein
MSYLDYTNRQLEEMIDAVKERLRALTNRVTDLEREVICLQRLATEWRAERGGTAEQAVSKKFEAEIFFLDPADVPPARTTLTNAGLEFGVIPDAVDPAGPTVFVMLIGAAPAADEDALFIWLENILRPLGGEIAEAGLVEETERRRAQLESTEIRDDAEVCRDEI